MDDLPLLVEHFLGRAKPPRSGRDMPAGVWAMFNAHRWPGNVRELSNAVQRFIVTPERVLMSSPESEPSKPRPTSSSELPPPLRVARREASEEFEKAYLSRVLEYSQGQVVGAAAIAQVSRQMVHKLMRKHGMD
jgi:DNA-binding NtrC family response regulator